MASSYPRPTVTEMQPPHDLTARIRHLTEYLETLRERYRKERDTYHRNKELIREAYLRHKAEFDELQKKIVETEGKLLAHDETEIDVINTVGGYHFMKLKFERKQLTLKKELEQLNTKLIETVGKKNNMKLDWVKCGEVYTRLLNRLIEQEKRIQEALQETIARWKRTAVKHYSDGFDEPDFTVQAPPKDTPE